jgi:outer membrane protein TolC
MTRSKNIVRFKAILLVLFFSLHGIVKAQDSASKVYFTEENLIAIVSKYHPVIKQADIEIQKAGMEILFARGAFDPYFKLSSDQKTFDGKQYYQFANPEIKIPTWYGVELKAGLEANSGARLSSENTLGNTSYAGITLPLAKNLVIDKRRAVLQQAKIFKQQTYSQRAVIVNDILKDALDAYWEWVKAVRVNKILSNAVKINQDRYQLVRKSFIIGERPAIDTTEALSQLQNFQFLESESAVKVKTKAVELSNFLWKDNNQFYELPDSVSVDDNWDKINFDTIVVPVLQDVISGALSSHPKLKVFRDKMASLEVNRKLKFQDLLPVINLRGNLLNNGFNVFNGIKTFGYYGDYNKFGIDIGIPLRLSEGRAGYKIAKLKIQETDFEISLQRQQIENKIKYYFNELVGFQQQIKVYENIYKNYSILFRGEEVRFRAGESSLFLLNSRENKVLEAAQKLAELKAKFYQSRVSLSWSAGELR